MTVTCIGRLALFPRLLLGLTHRVYQRVCDTAVLDSASPDIAFRQLPELLATLVRCSNAPRSFGTRRGGSGS